MTPALRQPPDAATARTATDAPPLRWRLLTLFAAALLPLFLAATLTVAYMLRDRERAMERNAMALARSIGAALQAEVQTAVATLETLAVAEPLRAGRLPAFENQARGVAHARGWRTVTLIDATGTVLLSTDDPRAGGQPAWERSSVDEVLATGRPTVGRVVRGQLTPAPAFSIRVPVAGPGGQRWVLSAVTATDRILDVVKRKQLSEDPVVAVFDSAGTRIARSVGHATDRPSSSLRALIDGGGDEGAGLTQTLEGDAVHTAFHRLAGSGWVVAVGIPEAASRTAMLTSLATASLGLLGSLAVSAWLAWFFARRVSEPIETLKRAAHALGRGEAVQVPRLDIEELQEVAGALTLAASERDRSSAERNDLLAQTTDALQRAETASRTKDEFLAVLGHELRNPLAPIANALQLMALKDAATTRKERAIIERQLRHMTRLVDDLLDVSRITSRRLKVRKELVQVGPWIEQALEAVRGSLGDRRLEVDLTPDLADGWVFADPARLVQMLTNLLGNAVKFTAADGCIRVAVMRVDGQVAVEVVDDGVGMSPAEMARAFDPFYQAPQATDRALGGLGLGLPIVRSLVEVHDGSVTAESDGPDQGSRFTLRLPCAEAPARPPAPVDAPPPPPAATAVRVLVVDDNQDAADSTAALLEAHGLDARAAYTPEQALEALRGFAAHVAILDIGLPGLDGYQLAARVRRQDGGDRIGLVALTGYGQAADVQRARAAGFDAHLTKPAEPDPLLALVLDLAAGRAGPSPDRD